MKFYTSYFYMVRFFTPNMIPLSTTCSDPRWYHNGGMTYFDKNKVLCGLRAEYLHPNSDCAGLCDGQECKENFNSCRFLMEYKKQLARIDFNKFLNDCEDVVNKIRIRNHFKGEPTIVLLVYEPPTRECSERGVIQNWIQANGYKCEEWGREK